MSKALTYVYAAVIDILGYKYQLEADKKSGRSDFKDSLNRAMNIFRAVNEADYNYEAISDTLIITCSDRDKFIPFLEMLKTVFISFLSETIFVRGGIAYAQHFKSRYVTYSYALALAHNLETTAAIYPRLVVDHNIIDMFKTAGEYATIAKSNLVSIHNDIFFINIINKRNWNMIYRYAKTLYENDRSLLLNQENIFLKHAWFENYLFQSEYRNKKMKRYIPSIELIK